MPFVNSVLTDMEVEMFKERAIPYPTEIWWKKGNVLGYNPYRNPKATINRESKIYLFNCGNHPNTDEIDDYYFSMVWDEVFNDSQVFFHLKEVIKLNSGYDIAWKIQKVKVPNGINVNNELLYEKLKEALSVYGFDGDTESRECYNVKFDF